MKGIKAWSSNLIYEVLLISYLGFKGNKYIIIIIIIIIISTSMIVFFAEKNFKVLFN